MAACGTSSRNSPSRFGSKADCQDSKPGRVATRTIKAVDKPKFDRVASDTEYDRDCRGRCLER